VAALHREAMAAGLHWEAAAAELLREAAAVGGSRSGPVGAMRAAVTVVGAGRRLRRGAGAARCWPWP
jgi:hypothetical protein